MAKPQSFGIAFALLLLALPRAAAAGAPPVAEPSLVQAKAAYEEAEKEYALGHFEDALKGYERAFGLKPLPAFLYNIGQCQRHLGHWERASYFFQGYLTREPHVKNRAKVVALVDEMNAKQRAEEQAAAAAGPAPVVGSPPPSSLTGGVGAAGTVAVASAAQPATSAEKEPARVTLSPEVLKTPPPEPQGKPLYKRWWVWTAVGVVAVGAVVGGVAGYSAANPRVATDALQGSLGSPIDATQ